MQLVRFSFTLENFQYHNQLPQTQCAACYSIAHFTRLVGAVLVRSLGVTEKFWGI